MDNKYPPDWGRDTLSDYLNKAQDNVRATFANIKHEYGSLVTVDSLYRLITDNLVNSKALFPSFFLFKAHSCFLAAIQLGMSGQIYEIHPVLRACLEASVCGWYLGNDEGRITTWGSRQDSNAARRKSRDEFQFSRMLDSLRAVDAQTCDVAKDLYEDTIDWGAHPNVAGILLGVRQEAKDKATVFKTSYLAGEREKLSYAMLATSRVGRCSLSIFRNIFTERFDLLGISERLCSLNTPERRLRR